MEINFYIQENRLDELKLFIRAELITPRFKYNPLKMGNEYNIVLNLSVEDGNKLSKFLNTMYLENSLEKKHKSIWKRIIDFFK